MKENPMTTTTRQGIQRSISFRGVVNKGSAGVFAKDRWLRIKVCKGRSERRGYDDDRAKKEEAEGNGCRLKAGGEWCAVIVV